MPSLFPMLIVLVIWNFVGEQHWESHTLMPIFIPSLQYYWKFKVTLVNTVIWGCIQVGEDVYFVSLLTLKVTICFDNAIHCYFMSVFFGITYHLKAFLWIVAFHSDVITLTLKIYVHVCIHIASWNIFH